jgi:hypothetical protein
MGIRQTSRRLICALGIAAALVLYCLPAARAVSLHPAITQRQDDAVQTTNNVTQEQAPGVPIVWERWTVVIGALQTAALVVTFCVMIFVAIRQLRAYVSVTTNFMFSFDGTTTLPRAGYALENRGATPARDIYTNANIGAFDYPLPSGFHLPAVSNLPQPKTALFPGANVKGQVTGNKLFTAAEIAAILAGSMRIYVYGTARYKDMFGFRRLTHFGASVRADTATLASLVSAYQASDLSLEFEHVTELNDVT